MRSPWRLLAALLAAIMTLVCYSVAYADTGDAPTAAAAFTDVVFKLLLAVLVTVATAAGREVLQYVNAKLDAHATAAQERVLDAWVAEAVSWVEEQIHKQVKAKAQTWSAGKKLDAAAAHVLEQIRANEWDRWGEDLIKRKIEAKLHWRRPSPAPVPISLAPLASSEAEAG